MRYRIKFYDEDRCTDVAAQPEQRGPRPAHGPVGDDPPEGHRVRRGGAGERAMSLKYGYAHADGVVGTDSVALEVVGVQSDNVYLDRMQTENLFISLASAMGLDPLEAHDLLDRG